MIGVVLATHGEVAPALLRAGESIVGTLERVRAITLQAGADPDELRRRVDEAVREVDDGEGVLILCDMFGGTPANVCLACQLGTEVEVVTGVNLPMVLKLASARASGIPVHDVAAQIAAYGQRHIAHATELVRERQRRAEAANPTQPGGQAR